jgi:2-polyprenyl-3-methyl-5-hydroxy-6-metoxy-1,4-benzoquinol methylase
VKHKFKDKRASSNDHLVAWLRQNIKPNSSLLDLGCGPKLYSNRVRDLCDPVLTVDAWSWVEPDVVADLETTSLHHVTHQRWDYVLMLDFIEHLDKSAGQRLITEAMQIANRGIFLLTPLQQIWTDNSEHVDDEKLWSYGNNYDLHKSVWHPDDFAGWQRAHLPKLDNYYVGFYAA